MRRLSGTAYVLIGFMVLTPLFVIFSLQFSYFASKMLPVTFSSAVFVLAAISLIREIRKTGKPSAASRAASSECEVGVSDRFRDYLPFAGWVIAFSLSIYFLGFTVSNALFTGAYMKRHGSSWRGAIITAIIFAGLIHLVFDIFLQSDLYRGQIFLNLGIKF